MAKKTVKKDLCSVEDVARFFIWKANQEGKPITNKKLQKLLYYAQAWHVTLSEPSEPLFKDEIEAWVHGPAVRRIYLHYKKFGFAPITIEVSEAEVKELKDHGLLNDIWKVYGKYDAEYLEQLTHEEEPWQKARQGLEVNESSDNAISLESMKDYYSTKI